MQLRIAEHYTAPLRLLPGGEGQYLKHRLEKTAANDEYVGEDSRPLAPLHWSLLRSRSRLPLLPTDLLQRPRLESILDHGFGAAQTGNRASASGSATGCVWYIWGPAGSGKSTLVRSWLENAGATASLTWVTLRAGDGNQDRLTTLLEATLLSDAEFIEHRETVVERGPLTPEDRVWLLCRKLEEKPDPVHLVLDQLDLIYLPHVNELLRQLVLCAPANLGITLIARRPPPSSLESLEQIQLLDPQYLALTLDEARQMVTLSAGNLSSEPMLEAIRSECDGWLLPIRLFALNADRHGSLVSSLADVPAVARFLREQVLGPLPLPEQEALFCLVDAEVLSDELAQVMLAREGFRVSLNRDVLMELGIPIVAASGQGAWYRLNGLLQAWIMRQSRSGVNLRRLFLSQWFARRGDQIAAVHYAAHAGDHEQAIAIATACSESLLLNHNVDALAQLRPVLSQEAIESSPRLRLVYAWVHAVSGQFSLAREMAARAEATDAVFAARRVALEAFIACGEGDIDRAETAAHEALAQREHLSAHAHVMILLALSSVARTRGQFQAARNWNREAAGSARHLADYGCESLVAYEHARIELSKGYLARSMQLLQAGLEQSQVQARRTPSAAESRLLLTQALIAWHRGSWELADRLLGQGLPEAERAKDLSTLLGFCVRIMLFHARGDDNAAFVALGQAERLMQHWRVDRTAYQPVLESLKASLWLMDADQARAATILESLEGRKDDRIPELFPILPGLRQILQVRAQLKVGEVDRALEVLSELQNEHRDFPPLAGQSLYLTLLKAQAWHLKGQEDKALRLLRNALKVAADEDFISPFIELQYELAPLLRQAFEPGEGPGIQRLLRRRLKVDTSPVAAAEPGPGEVISDRELAVLDLIAQGLSNQEIGDRLHISLHTVKTHARKINVKLGVRSRTQAIVRARALGYL